GRAKGTAMEAVAKTATWWKPLEANSPTGMYWVKSVEQTTPKTRAGKVRTITWRKDRRNADAPCRQPTGRPVRFLVTGSGETFATIRSTATPPKTTAAAA